MYGEYEFCEPTNTSTNESDMHDEMEEILNDAFGMSMPNEESERSPHVHEEFEKPNKDANKFYNLLREADHELYLGCKKFTKLSFIIRLFHMKCLNGWSNKSFTMLLELLKEAFPEGETLQSNYYEAKKYFVTLAFIISKLMHAPQIACCIQKSMQMKMSVLFVVSLNGNQVMIILQMSSLIQQRKKKSC